MIEKSKGNKKINEKQMKNVDGKQETVTGRQTNRAIEGQNNNTIGGQANDAIEGQKNNTIGGQANNALEGQNNNITGRRTNNAIEAIKLIICFAIAVVIALGIRYYLGEIIQIQHISMSPTLEPGERSWIRKIQAKIGKVPQRGDIITFEAPIEQEEKRNINLIAEYGNEPKGILDKFNYSFIKRVIGLPNEKIKISNGNVYINGRKLDESKYLQEDEKTTTQILEYAEIVIPKNCIFVMGDNRDESVDSRYFGCIPIDKIEGKVIIRVWPFSKFGKIKS